MVDDVMYWVSVGSIVALVAGVLAVTYGPKVWRRGSRFLGSL
jgi:hypothetical protein